MTKIYVVLFSRVNKLGYEEISHISDIFTNRKKAETYCDYRNLKMKNRKWNSELKEFMYKVKTMEISQLDWSEELELERNSQIPF